MNSSDEADEIRRQMQQIRVDVRDDVASLVDRIHNYTDWRYHWRNHPWWCLGTATAAGFLLVPRRNRIVKPSPEDLARLARQPRVIVEESVPSRGTGAVTTALLTMLGRAMMRGTASYLEKNGSRLLHELWTRNKNAG
jgi:hypothetical protein